MSPSMSSSDSSALATAARVPSDVYGCVGAALGVAAAGWGLGHLAHHLGDVHTQAAALVVRGASVLSYGFALLFVAAALEAWHEHWTQGRGAASPAPSHGPALHLGPLGVGLLLVVGLGAAASQLPWLRHDARVARSVDTLMPGLTEAALDPPDQARQVLAEPTYAALTRHLGALSVQAETAHTVVQVTTDAVHCRAMRQWLSDHLTRDQALIVTEQGEEVPSALLACPRTTTLTFRPRPQPRAGRHLIRVTSLGSLTLTV